MDMLKDRTRASEFPGWEAATLGLPLYDRVVKDMVPKSTPPCSAGETHNITRLRTAFKAGKYKSVIVDQVLTPDFKSWAHATGFKYPRVFFKDVSHIHEKEGLDGEYDGVLKGACEDGDVGDFGATHRAYYMKFPSIAVPLSPSVYTNPRKVFEDGRPHFVGDFFRPITPVDIKRTFDQTKPNLTKDMELLLPNFLYELREVGEIIPRLLQARSKLKLLAAGYLTYQFAIAPTIRDIGALVKLFTSLEGRIRTWNELADKGSVLSFKGRIVKDDKNASVTRRSGTFGPYSIHCEAQCQIARIATLHMYVRPQRVSLSDKDLRDIVLEATGFDNLAAVVWEAIPFSFVIDWITNVGSLFDTDRKEWLSYDIVDLGYGDKHTTTFKSVGDMSLPGYDKRTPPVHVPGKIVPLVPYKHQLVDYKRVKLSASLYEGSDIEYNNLCFRAPTNKQLLLSAALVVVLRK